METKICIYCGRTLDLSMLSEKAGTYRCKDENDCLAYQTGDEEDDSIDHPDYISDIVKSSLSDAAERVAVYKQMKNDQTMLDHTGEDSKTAEETIAEFARLKSLIDGFASEYMERDRFQFQYEEVFQDEYRISFSDSTNNLNFIIKIKNIPGSRCLLTIARKLMADDKDSVFEEFIFKSYPMNRQEDVVKDVSVILLILEEEKELLPALFKEFRMEVEARHYRDES